MCLKKTKPNQKNFLSFQRLAYYLPFLVMNVPSSSAVVPFSLSAEEWLWFPLPLITIKETSLIFFFLFLFNGRFKSYENNSRHKCEFATYLSSSPPHPLSSPPCFCITELTDAGEMTQVRPQHICLLIKKVGLMQSSFPSLKFTSPGRGGGSLLFVCVHNLTPHHERAS